MTVPLVWYVFLALILFTIGLVVIVSRHNLIYTLMGVELILNGANINFIAFARALGGKYPVAGNIFSVFVIVLAAAEAAVALAIVLHVFGHFGSVRPEDPNMLRE